MPSRTWMVALTLTLAAAAAVSVWGRMLADGEAVPEARPRITELQMVQSRAPEPRSSTTEATVVNQVQLELMVSGLDRRGCLVEIRPGHASCHFRPVRYAIPANQPRVRLDPPIEVTSTNADRDCTFAITITEPGQPPKTYRRGIRLAAQEPGEPVPVRSLTCYLSTPSLAASQAHEPARAKTARQEQPDATRR